MLLYRHAGVAVPWHPFAVVPGGLLAVLLYNIATVFLGDSAAVLLWYMLPWLDVLVSRREPLGGREELQVRGEELLLNSSAAIGK